MNLAANTTLLVDGGTVNKTSTAGFIFSDNTTTRIKNGGSFTTPSSFDLGNATLDIDNATLTVGTVSFWGGSALSLGSSALRISSRKVWTDGHARTSCRSRSERAR